jgi:hypothetical protein
VDEQNDQITHRRIVAGRGIPRNYGRNNNSLAISECASARSIRNTTSWSEAEGATEEEVAGFLVPLPISKKSGSVQPHSPAETLQEGQVPTVFLDGWSTQ